MSDHARIGLDIWGDDEWLDLPPDAQHLYFVLKTMPPSFCGAGDWHPGKIAARAKGWTADAVCSSAQVLVDGLFLLIDTNTEEFLLRSWIKHDGLYKVPNMAVSMANARALLASRLLRGVVVHEVQKLQKAQPDLTSWARDTVAKMLTQKAVNPGEVEWPKVAPNPSPNPPPKGWVNPSPNPRATESPNPGANPGPTPSPTPAPFTPLLQEGYVSQLTHLGGSHEEPSPFCAAHQSFNGTIPNCPPCGDARKAHAAWKQDEVARKRRENAAAAKAMQDCDHCDEAGWFLGEDGKPVEPATKCIVHLLAVS